MRVAVVDNVNTQFISGILGSVSTSDLLDRINNKLQSCVNENFNHVRDIITKGKEYFVNNIIQNQLNIQRTIRNTLESIFKNDDEIIKPLIKDDDFKNVPKCMYEPILTFRPIRELHKENRIFGFGLDYQDVPNRDVYAKLIHNGTCKDVDYKLENNKEIRCISIWSTNDPDLTLDDIDNIEITRWKILELLEKKIDPTDYPNNIG